ncbi:MAG: transglutaminase domain-containing protein [Terriglobales bacterium]
MLRRASVLALMSAFSVPAFAAKAPQTPPKQASFHVSNTFTVKVPKGAKSVRIWFAVPQEDAYSIVRNFNVISDHAVRYRWDSWENRVGYVDIENPTGEQVILKEEFDLTRTEVRNTINSADTRPLTEDERAALAAYLQPSKYVVVNDEIRKLAASITGGETNPVVAARKLYDWTYKNVNYWVKDPEHLKASPVGSTDYCLRSKTGNCTDFHSLFASLAISSGIPTRMVYGSLLKPTLNGMEVDASYHCWIEFFAPRLGWLPLDASLANIYAEEIPLNDKNTKLVELTTSTGYHGPDKSKVEYYFGNLDERRVVWSVGRDLIMQPPQDDGPVNSLPKMYVEIDAKQSADWTRQLTYKEIGHMTVNR